MTEDADTVSFAVPTDEPTRFLDFFLHGVAMAVPGPMSVDRFFREVLGRDDAFINAWLKTAFLNNHPLDDFTKTMLSPGDALSLSGPMPGLAGATMRAGGVLSGFRRGLGLAAGADHGQRPDGPFLIAVRLFNVLTESLAAPMLAAGFYAPLGRLLDFLARQPDAYRQAVVVRRGGWSAGLDQAYFDLLDADPADPALARAVPGPSARSGPA